MPASMPASMPAPAQIESTFPIWPPNLAHPVAVVVSVKNQGSTPIYVCLVAKCKKEEALKVDPGSEYQLQGFDLEAGILKILK
jgi:hypothetical protein